MDSNASAHALAASSLQIALFQMLVLKGLLTAKEVQETVEIALLQVEEGQAKATGEITAYEGARFLLATAFK